MQNERPFLVFQRYESGDVACLLRAYLSERQGIALSEDVRESLVHSRSLAGDLSLCGMMPPDATFAAVDQFCRVVMDRPTLLAPDSLEQVRLDDSQGQLSTAIRWAARELTAGSAVVDRESNWVLQTDYENMETPAAFGSTNASLAARLRQNLLGTGEAAGRWAQQLGPET